MRGFYIYIKGQTVDPANQRKTVISNSNSIQKNINTQQEHYYNNEQTEKNNKKIKKYNQSINQKKKKKTLQEPIDYVHS